MKMDEVTDRRVQNILSAIVWTTVPVSFGILIFALLLSGMFRVLPGVIEKLSIFWVGSTCVGLLLGFPKPTVRNIKPISEIKRIIAKPENIRKRRVRNFFDGLWVIALLVVAFLLLCASLKVMNELNDNSMPHASKGFH